MERPPTPPLPAPAHHHHCHQTQNLRPYTHMKMAVAPLPLQSQGSDNDQTTGELRPLDCNLTSLCDHIQSEGFSNGSFSDVVIHAMGSTYHLHRLILSRSSYFRNMLHGPWKESTAPVVTLQIDDKNVNGEAIATALAYLYGHHPKLTDSNAFRVLAAASFLDLQDLCVICTDFIVSELWTSNFLTYQVFAENQDYGIHGERVRCACWGYLCQGGSVELKEVLPKLSSHTLHMLLTSNELWVPNEEKRFELALDTLFKKGSDKHEIVSLDAKTGTDSHQLSDRKEKGSADSGDCRSLESHTGQVSSKLQQVPCTLPLVDARYPSMDQPSSMSNPFSDTERNRPPYSYVEMPINYQASGQGCDGMPVEGPSEGEESLCYQFTNNSWLSDNELGNSSSQSLSCNLVMPNEWSGYDMHQSWGGRVVGKRKAKGFTKSFGVKEEEYDTFNSIFEGGSLLYCNMSFEALLNVRKVLEELGFPCKAVNDALWLQMLLSQRVQEIAAETCRNCCLLGMACACRLPFSFSHGAASTNYYVQAPDQHFHPANAGDLYVADAAPGEGNGVFRPVRVHVRGSNDGLAGIGRGTTFVPANAWPPTRFVYSRVPCGVGNRNGQQALGNDDQVPRLDQNGDLSGDGLTALVGLSEARRNVHSTHEGQTDRALEMDIQNSSVGTSTAGPCSSAAEITESPEGDIQWESSDSASISLDLKTPLSHFPPFRFGVEFEDVHRLADGQVKHSPEAFYAGSLWKVSVQAFSDEDPQGRRTLGLFIHRRKTEITDPLRKVHLYTDSREKVTARYQLICPSKREVMVFGSFKQPGTLLPKAPKGWGWRSALLFDELPDLLQNGCLRVSAVVQLV